MLNAQKELAEAEMEFEAFQQLAGKVNPSVSKASFGT